MFAYLLVELCVLATRRTFVPKRYLAQFCTFYWKKWVCSGAVLGKLLANGRKVGRVRTLTPRPKTVASALEP